MAMGEKPPKDQVKFVDPPTEEYYCPICLGILQEPYLTACCGNHFCEACIKKVKEGASKCPLCKETPLNGMQGRSQTKCDGGASQLASLPGPKPTCMQSVSIVK